MRVFCMILCLTSVVAVRSEWTHTYRCEFPDRVSDVSYVCAITRVPAFTHLVCSWNALWPESGYFALWGRIRDARTRRWSAWHHLHDWGAQIQRSHYNVTRTVTNYYVRLEAQQPADGFEIRVDPHDGAHMAHMHRLFVNISQKHRMQEEFASKYATYQSVAPMHVPAISQHTINHPHCRRMCSPVSMTMVLRYLSKADIAPVAFAQTGYDYGLGTYGSWPYTVSAAYTWLPHNYGICVQRLADFGHLLWCLKRRNPVVISVRGDIQNAPRSYQYGHLLVVTGFDAEHLRVACADPYMCSDDQVHVWYALSDILKAWERSCRLAYTVQRNISV